MGLYRRHVLPRLIHLACSSKPAMRERSKVVPGARGRVLDVGAGSGLALESYAPGAVDSVVGLDPSRKLTEMAGETAAGAAFPVARVLADGEAIPFRSGAFDTVVTTYSLCTIPDVERALAEIARVLAPGGRLLFCEHGLAPEPEVRRWQHGLDGLWPRIAGGCHLDRDVPELLRRAGFEVRELESEYMEGWRPVSYHYRGVAEPARGRGRFRRGAGGKIARESEEHGGSGWS